VIVPGLRRPSGHHRPPRLPPGAGRARTCPPARRFFGFGSCRMCTWPRARRLFCRNRPAPGSGRTPPWPGRCPDLQGPGRNRPSPPLARAFPGRGLIESNVRPGGFFLSSFFLHLRLSYPGCARRCRRTVRGGGGPDVLACSRTSAWLATYWSKGLSRSASARRSLVSV